MTARFTRIDHEQSGAAMDAQPSNADWTTPRLSKLSVGFDTAFEGGSSTDGSTKAPGSIKIG